MNATAARPLARLAAIVTAFLLPILYSPSLATPDWTVRAALLLVVSAIGLPRLAPLVRTRLRWAALAAMSLLVVAAVSALLSHRPLLSVVGLYAWGTGLLFVVAIVASWALGASLAERDTHAVVTALLAAVVLNAAVALVQGAVDLGSVPFTRYEGRAAGLLGNPVHLGTLTAASIPLLFSRARDRRPWTIALFVVGAALELSGSRFALALGAAAALVLVIRDWRHAVPSAAVLAAGILVGVLVGAVGGTSTGTGRIASGGEGGITARVHVWMSARHSIVDHPVVGVGPGQFRTATSRHRDLDLVRAEGPDRYFLDAHNLVVEYGTTLGLLGLLALGAWVVAAIRGASGPLLAFALIALAVHLVEPQFVGTTPLALLALGAAAAAAPPTPRPVNAATIVLLVPALGAAAVLVFGDFQLDQARLDFNPAAAHTASDLLAPWAEPPALAGRVSVFRFINSHTVSDESSALRWKREALRRDPTSPGAWADLGETQALFRDVPGATVSFRTALTWDPWSVRALNGLGSALRQSGDRGGARRAFERSLVADPAQTKVRRQLAELTRP